MYFRVLDNQGSVIENTNNCRTHTAVKMALIWHLQPHICEADLNDLIEDSLGNILKSQGYILEQDEQPFCDDYDYDNEIHKEWLEAYGAY